MFESEFAIEIQFDEATGVDCAACGRRPRRARRGRVLGRVLAGIVSLLAARAEAQESSTATSAAPLQPLPAEPGAAAGAPPVVPKPEIREVTITARKRKERAQTVPAAVTTVPPVLLERGDTRDLRDIEGRAPNVVIDELRAGPGGAAISIRGIGFDDIEKSFDPAVGVTIDGVYIGTNTTQLQNNFDIESIEILRGPQGTLFGRNTPAGMINIQTTRPTGELGAKGSVTLGSFGRNDYKLVLNTPVVQDVLAAKATFFRLGSSGYIDTPVLGGKGPSDDYMSGGLTLLFTPVKGYEALVKYEHVRDRSGLLPLTNGSPPFEFICAVLKQCNSDAKNVSQANYPNSGNMNLDALTATQDLRFGPNTLTSVTGWRGNNEGEYQDYDASAADFYSAHAIQRYDQFSEELRIASRPVEGLDLVAGTYFWYARYRSHQDAFFFPQYLMPTPPPNSVRTRDTGQITKSIAGFAQGDWEFLPHARLTLGGRYTYEHKDFDAKYGFSTFDSMEPHFLPSAGWGSFTPKVGLDYTFDQGKTGQALIYATYSRGFRSGGFNGRAVTITAANTPYNPENVDQYEVGAKTEFLERHLIANVAGFYTRYHDKQESVFRPTTDANGHPGSPETIVDNAASAKIQGLEFELSATPPTRNHYLEGLRVWGNVGLLDAKYSSFTAALSGPVRDYTDLELRRAPKWEYGIGGMHRLELGFGRTILDVYWHARAKQRVGITLDPTGAPDARGIAPSLGMLDASATLELDHLGGLAWRLTVFGRNLTNNVELNNYLDVPPLFAFKWDNMPRWIGVELQATF